MEKTNGVKTCSCCKTDKLLSDFYKDSYKKSGLSSRCIICTRKEVKKWRKENPKKRAEADKRYSKKYPEKMRENAAKWRFNNPEKAKLVSKKYRQKQRQQSNLEEIREKARIYYKANPERFKKYYQSFREKHSVLHRERARKWAANNRERVRLNVSKWQKANVGKVRAMSRKRALYKLKAIPKWANLRRIESIYKAAAQKLGFVVDHIIPLQGKTVCGLHVENNLSIILCRENSEKSNKLLF